jgi:hypothetical protein
VIFEQRLEALSRGQILECQRPLTTVLAPQHAVGLPGAISLGVDACHTQSLLREVLRQHVHILRNIL